MRFSTGQTIGRYVIESLLGEGGMGEVYRARDSKLERKVALKVLRNDTDGSSEDWEHAVMRMQREAQAVAALSHPGIVAIYDIGEHDGSPFIAMELVGGQPLREIIGKDTPMGTRLRILLDVARALGAAHEAGFVHRDIKPENILVREDGVAKVLDFGIARKTSHRADANMPTLDIQGATVDAALVGMTAEGALVGTPAYMAPEQLRGETADARADQFAWGVVAYELLSGKHPFQTEKGAVGLLASILSDVPPPLSGIPDAVAAVVMRALEKEPEHRWPSMQEIALQCEAFITDGDARKVPTGPRPELAAISPSQTGSVTRETPRSWSRWLVGPFVGVIALSALAFGFRQRSAPNIAPVTLPSATPVPSTTATAVTDLPIPASSSVEAVAAFREGLQSIRDARWTAAAAAFNRARRADPGMAAAHLRFAVIGFSYEVTSARDAYRKALGLRSSLTERDQGFLHAIEPVIQREPSDYGEAAKRFETLVARYPGDAELTFWLSRTSFYHSSTPESLKRIIELNERCVELDPRYADCWQTKASALSMSGKLDEAVTTLDECIKVSENGVDCLLDKIRIDSVLGRCDVVVESARQLKTKDPSALNASLLLAESLYFSGEPEPVVRAAFADAERHSREAGRLYEASKAQLHLAIAFGDFATALDHANSMATSMTLPGPAVAIGLYLLRAELYLEMGKLTEAAAVADEFLVERALHPASSNDMQVDPTLGMHALRLRAGKLTRREFESLRAAWLTKQKPVTEFDHYIVWLTAYGIPTIFPDLTQDAIDNASKLPRKWHPSTMRFTKSLASFQGRVFMLAGRYAESLPFFEQGLRVCTVDDASLWHTQTIAQMGIAREATGDKPGACKAYEQVLSRWGKSKQSVTVKDVRRRAKKIGCEAMSGK